MHLDRIPNYVGVNLMFIFNRNWSKLAEYTKRSGIPQNGEKMGRWGEENWGEIRHGVQIGQSLCAGCTNTPMQTFC